MRPRDKKEQCKVMLVVSHKREVDGPAPIPLDSNMVHQLEIFITNLRSVVTKNGSDSRKIFLKTDGAPFQKATISWQITTFVSKTGVRVDHPISATDFRKWLVTRMRQQMHVGIPINEDLLRRLMCHSEKSADLVPHT